MFARFSPEVVVVLKLMCGTAMSLLQPVNLERRLVVNILVLYQAALCHMLPRQSKTLLVNYPGPQRIRPGVILALHIPGAPAVTADLWQKAHHQSPASTLAKTHTSPLTGSTSHEQGLRGLGNRCHEESQLLPMVGL